MTAADLWTIYGDEVASVPLGVGTLQQIVAHREGTAPSHHAARVCVHRVTAEGGPSTSPPAIKPDQTVCKRYIAVELAGLRDEPEETSTPAAECRPIETALILSDVHIPYQHERACDAVLERILRMKPDVVVANGDIIDAKSLGRFARSPDAARIGEELDGAETFFASVRQASGKSRIRVTEGNHELRLKRYLMTDAAGLFGLSCLDLRSLLGLTPAEWTAYGKTLRIGPMAISHGRLLSSITGFSARRALTAALENGTATAPMIVVSHCHRLGAFTRATPLGMRGAVETGCLADWERADYCPTKPNWHVGWVEAEWRSADELPMLRPVLAG